MILGIPVMFIYIGAALASISVINLGASNGTLSGAFTRTIKGGTTTVVSANFLRGYTNTEQFISACINGSLGFAGYVFIGGLTALLITWVGNIYEYKRLVA
jgi:hypothetical protein